MNPKHTKTIPVLTVLLLFVLLGGPQMAVAQSAAPQEPQPAPQELNPQATIPQTGTTEAPAQTGLPEAPSAQQPVGTPALPQDAQPQTKQDSQPSKGKDQDQAPVGAAAAQKGATAGGAASKPAGTAIAPVKQRQVRSFLLKLGLVAAGGAAIGTVYALSRGTSSVPPGSGR
jgi:cytoskeletal protein RodZ